MQDSNRLTAKSLSQQTYFQKERLWFDNFVENLPAVRSGRDVKERQKLCAGPCVVVGAGPSVEKSKALDQLAEFSCHVFATDRMLIPLLEHGIVPEYVLSVDGAPKIADFYDSPLVREPAESGKLRAVFNTQVSPSVVALFPGEVYWFTILWDNPLMDGFSITRAMYWMTREKTMSQAYGNVGGFSWAFAEFAGHDPIILAGIDFSYGDEVQPMQTEYWKGFLERRKGKTQEVLKLDYRWVKNPFGHRVLTDAVWDGYASVLHHAVEASPARTVQTSPLTAFFGAKISCLPLEDALKKYATRGSRTARPAAQPPEPRSRLSP